MEEGHLWDLAEFLIKLGLGRRRFRGIAQASLPFIQLEWYSVFCDVDGILAVHATGGHLSTPLIQCNHLKKEKAAES